jgi:hypothetical protein
MRPHIHRPMRAGCRVPTEGHPNDNHLSGDDNYQEADDNEQKEDDNYNDNDSMTDETADGR